VFCATSGKWVRLQTLYFLYGLVFPGPAGIREPLGIANRGYWTVFVSDAANSRVLAHEVSHNLWLEHHEERGNAPANPDWYYLMREGGDEGKNAGQKHKMQYYDEKDVKKVVRACKKKF
jgi:hypothetical protein